MAWVGARWDCSHLQRLAIFGAPQVITDDQAVSNGGPKADKKDQERVSAICISMAKWLLLWTGRVVGNKQVQVRSTM